MLRPRIIPCLLIHQHGLVKTVNFKSPTYLGDPINAVRIFNEKEVDELIVLDIDASVQGKAPNYRVIEKLAAECRMPLCYGGGINSIDQVKRLIGLGVEKVAISAAAIENLSFIEEASKRAGSQSIVVVLDVKKRLIKRGYDIYTHNGTRKVGNMSDDFVRQLISCGVGEIVINSIDNDGLMKGYDTDLIDLIYQNIDIPLTVLGGAGSLVDIGQLFKQYKIIGAGAGSLFVFKGKYRAVLINYPTSKEKEELFGKYMG
jgi:imidazole glycerol-phosphate synthase subunit HisF